MTSIRKSVMYQTAGHWLRCFLGRAAMVGLVCAPVCPASYGQLDVKGPIHLISVEGLVVDTFGKPVANVEVSLARDNKVLLSTHTDKAGAFQIDHASGDYLFHVARSAYAPASQSIVVRLELVTLAQRKKLYVILGPGACADACSSVLTSKQEFEKTLRKLNKH